MAEQETKNNPKDLIEPTPEEVKKEEKPPRKLSRLEMRAKREEEAAKKSIEEWIPKTKIGQEVKSGKQKDLDLILESGKKILEPQIVDLLLPLKSDLILIGQAKGKFGGGKRRAWRQTQKKTKEGNILTFSSMAVVGDGKGHIGLGYGKSKETLPAREKALRKAKLNIIKIKLGYETPGDRSAGAHTVPFVVEGKCGSVRIKLIPAPRGTGLVIGDECKKILKLVGIKDVYAVTKGQTKTTFNLAKACIDALSKTTEMKL
tara:strand:+ start:705 stop:1484 length:780 start_codon:yes stop_codon:yes gene_type:complete